MSYPFIIWTMQRTGGTSLTELLMELSEHKPADHEPFNWQHNPRQFAAISGGWARTRDLAALHRDLAAIFAARYLIKHCYEFHAPSFNRELMRAAAAAGYRYIHLLRRDELSRILSKFIAQANGTWFKDYSGKVYAEIRAGRRRLAPLPVGQMVEQYRHARRMANDMRRLLQEIGSPIWDVDYEDLFAGEPQVRRENLRQLLLFLGFEEGTIDAARRLIDEKLLDSGQDTASILRFIPNFHDITAAFAAAGYRMPVLAASPRLGRSATADHAAAAPQDDEA